MVVARYCLLRKNQVNMATNSNNNSNEESKLTNPELPRVVTLNERILSSMAHKNDAAHPWHDLEIGFIPTTPTQSSLLLLLTIILLFLSSFNTFFLILVSASVYF